MTCANFSRGDFSYNIIVLAISEWSWEPSFGHVWPF